MHADRTENWTLKCQKTKNFFFNNGILCAFVKALCSRLAKKKKCNCLVCQKLTFTRVGNLFVNFIPSLNEAGKKGERGTKPCINNLKVKHTTKNQVL